MTKVEGVTAGGGGQGCTIVWWASIHWKDLVQGRRGAGNEGPYRQEGRTFKNTWCPHSRLSNKRVGGGGAMQVLQNKK